MNHVSTEFTINSSKLHHTRHPKGSNSLIKNNGRGQIFGNNSKFFKAFGPKWTSTPT